MENFNVNTLILNKADSNIYETFYAKADDANGRKLIVQITDAGLIVDTTGYSIVLGFRTSADTTGFIYFTALDITKGLYEVEYPTSMMVPGVVKAELKIYNLFTVVSSKTFNITVDKSVIDETTIVATNNFSVLQDALFKVNEWDAQFQDKYDGLEVEYAENLTQVTADLAQKAQQFIAVDAEILALQTDKADKVEVNALVTEKVDTTVFNSAIASIGDGTPLPYDGTLVELQVDVTVDETKFYVIMDATDTVNYNHKVYYNGSAWVDGGVYVPGEPQDWSIAKNKLNPEIYSALVSFYPLTFTTEYGWINKIDNTWNTGGTTYKTTDYIPVTVGENFKITANHQVGSNVDCTLVRYDASHVKLGHVSTDLVDYAYTPTVNGYVKVISYDGNPIVKKEIVDTRKQIGAIQESLTELQVGKTDEAYVNAQIDGISIEKNNLNTELFESLIDYSDVETIHSFGFINRYNGTFTAVGDESYITTDFIPMVIGDKFKITTSKQVGNATDCNMCIYDNTQAFSSAKTNEMIDYIYTATFDGYIRVSDYQGTPIVKKLVADTRILLKKLSESVGKSYHYGKIVWWGGTSISAGGAVGSYPLLVGELLGAIVENKSVGTSTVRCGTWERVTVDDPLGIRNAHWQIATRSLIQTIAEKQDIIDHWDDIWGGLSSDPRKLYLAPDTLSEAEKTTILNSSYEHLITPYLDGTYPMPDLWVFDHGWNDGAYYSLGTGGTEELSTIPTDRYNRHYFIGACNLIMKMILAANPKARIIFIGHYENKRRPWVNDAQKVLADYWGFDLIKLWEHMGLSENPIPTTGYWENGLWISSGGTLRELTPIQMFSADELHPHSDLSGDAINFYAKVLAPLIEVVR